MLHIVRSDIGIDKPVEKGEVSSLDHIRVFFFLVSPLDQPKLQLRLLSRLMDIVERDNFVEDVCEANNDRKVKEYLLHNDRYITLEISRNLPTVDLIDRMMKDIRLSQDVLVAIVQRGEKIITPRGDTMLLEGDIITIIGEPKGIKSIFEKYLRIKS